MDRTKIRNIYIKIQTSSKLEGVVGVVVSTPAPLSAGKGVGWGVKPPTKFSKRGGGLDRISILRGRLLGKMG